MRWLGSKIIILLFRCFLIFELRRRNMIEKAFIMIIYYIS